MPCSDGHYSVDEFNEVIKRLNDATMVACELGRVLEQRACGLAVPVTTFSRNWLARHEEEDRRRAEQYAKEAWEKQLRKAGLAKLTPEERRALKLPEA